MTRLTIATLLIALLSSGCGGKEPTYNDSVCGYQAAIVGGSAFPGDTPTTGFAACSGVYIAPNVILTAKHCDSGDYMKVHTTRYDHPIADLTALVLDTPNLETPYAMVGEPALGEARVEGYGLNETGSAGLRKGATVYIDEINLTTIHTVPGDGYECFGDSGGPLYIDGEVVGIISTGDGTHDCGEGTRHVNISAFGEWVDSIVEGNLIQAPTPKECL